ncbi:DUF349 domain-containing protein [Planococcus sp. APC 4015]|nr:DUF349 domain-containing protein [Planococcus sp. APC 4015]
MTAHADPISESPEDDTTTTEATTPADEVTTATDEVTTDEAADAVADAPGEQPEAEAPEAEAPEADASEAEAPEADASEAEAPAAEASEPEASEPEASEPEADAEPETAAPSAPSPVAVIPAVPGIPGPKPGSGPGAAPTAPWGRVDDDGTVSVRNAENEWRVIGAYPDGTPDEALAYFQRKFSDLASEVTLLEVRHRSGGASAADLRAAARTLEAKLTDAAAVGNLAALEARVSAMTGTLAAASETEAAEAREAVDEAVRQRTAIVEKAEALAARDPKSVQWKQASADLAALFDEWQSQQQNGPRLPKNTAQQLWKRFRDARATVDKHRREFYSQLDEEHKGVRDRKAKLVEKAEALAPQGEDGIGAYRDLLEQWKTSGRAGKKADDALWARFKAAGDALYSARADREVADTEASREKIDARKALLAEAQAVADESSIAKARTLLTGIQRRWDEIGRIFPREAERALDDDLRKIETALRTREETDWKRNNPETKARTNDMTRQLTEAIEKLEDQVAAAEKSGDKKAVAAAKEALEARRAWLRAVGG